ncbi:AraC family transcriptional regulator [Vibrio sp. 99-70-13A1]|uniref:helix-turn-helix domain-containing protein n=1 Tax=Vibrio sp. 99-70-13A1 TaxID=2607601 RepID=UPI0014937D27|nr:AraC family transcriptional regulator [Vibrio sp. 99-70-13A1]NOH95639.1 helix-turn-helix transcriptional regulator [Vibrio sp. 99-70-13A1]
MANRLPSSFNKSALIRWVEHQDRHTLMSDTPMSKEELLEGELINYKVNNSFSLHGGTSDELTDFQVISTAKKALIFVILLEGKLDFSYDDTRFVFDATDEPVGVVVNLTKPATFRRVIQKGNHVTKLNIVLPVEWVEERTQTDTNVGFFISQHIANFKLNLTGSVLKLTSEIILNSNPKENTGKINLESMTQKLISEIFSQISDCEDLKCIESEELNRVDLRARSNKNGYVMDSLVTFIEANLERELPAKELAQYAAMSESNLQRKFKAALGCSVRSYIRRRRLDIARQHLERGVATVTEAAYNAGYRHPSNFTIAFKKAFGYPPMASINREI